MTLPRHLAVLHVTRFRRAVALLMALVFVMLSATSVLAHAATGAEVGDRGSAFVVILEQAPQQGDPDDAGQPGAPHALPCHCHAIIGAGPEPYVLAVAAGLIGGPSVLPDQRLASRPTAPPTRPPCL